MLVLTRKVGEKIVIQGGIQITVLNIDIKYNAVKIGILAPKNISVHREEIQNKIDIDERCKKGEQL